MPRKKKATQKKNNQSSNNVEFIDHPLIHHKLSLLRGGDLSTSKYYALAKEIGMFLGFVMTRNLVLSRGTRQSPLSPDVTKKPVVVAMLRSGLVLSEGFKDVSPSVRIGHLGLYKKDDLSLIHISEPTRPY